MLRFLFEKEGYEIDTAPNGAAALAALGLQPVDAAKILPDLTLLDMMMPEMDGAQVCARMHADPRTKSVPVLMLTANGASQAPTAPNVVGYVAKPFDPRELRARVAAILGKKN